MKWFANRNQICNELGAGKILRDSIPRCLDTSKHIYEFLEALTAGSEPLRQMKLVVLGNGQIGKTTLLNAMYNMLNPNNQKVHCYCHVICEY
jgi:DNA replication protein DnaC